MKHMLFQIWFIIARSTGTIIGQNFQAGQWYETNKIENLVRRTRIQYSEL